ncbi:hypothetical protein IVB55_39455 [Bradyrhizobium sp. CW4]|uniref:hypothetical protein n=1 Tax=Bradyrhizobium sp. CW4 TaxID=2782687 RepID=UPI001FF8E25A|nr:hypothetical protein [Bradyrhizobium sp. CW4]MCK1418904.1 hypothetical protein [Bradyrhizobium sp. CW4]
MTDVKTKVAIIRWKDICRSLYMTGQMKDFSKAECFRVHALLEAKKAEGTVEQISRGHYQIKPALLAELDNTQA